jgi:hypothetical protein
VPRSTSLARSKGCRAFGEEQGRRQGRDIIEKWQFHENNKDIQQKKLIITNFPVNMNNTLVWQCKFFTLIFNQCTKYR